MKTNFNISSLKYLVAISVVVLYSFSGLAQTKMEFQQPILITSAGQSHDASMVGMLCKKFKVNTSTITVAQDSDLEGVKTLIVVPGFSAKGMGQAGTSREEELERSKKILAVAKEKKIDVILVHIGGKARRGVQSDDFNELVAQYAKYMIVVKHGDEDQFFSDLALKNKIPIKLVDKIADAGNPLVELFKP